MSRSVSKAAHYALQLDEARCEGDWDAVPEFVRKVRKHASSRACLTLTAETEYAIEKATRSHPPSGRAADASDPAAGLDAATLLPKLQAVIDHEDVFLQDRFQARVCVGWLHWVAGQYDAALAQLPESLETELTSSDRPAESLVVTDWTRVCALKSAYLRANCLARKDLRKEALAVFEDGLPCITSAHAVQQSRKQLRYWSELFLTEYCMLLSHTLEKGEASLEDPKCLVSFRSWAKYWEGTNGAAQLGGFGFRGSVPRRRIWFEYYALLSALLEDDLPYPPGYAPVGTGGESSARSHLRMELKRVEAVYETLLLEETSFPRAEDERKEVEEFVRLVVQNWSVLKGRGWRESDLGQGGRESASRSVLDILYRASTKTYHSTSILRYLFTVHLAVAEFDLAFKAFDSYLGLIKKGKARVAKTGKDEPHLDDDAVVLETVSLCIVALCRYGNRQASEKAHGLGQELEQCLHELSHALPEQVDEDNPAPRTTLVSDFKGTNIPVRVHALAWQAVGLSLAQWSRTTYDSASRTDIQAKAVRSLRKSMSPEFGQSANLRSVFSLSLLLVEQRDIGAAIDLVKAALLSNKPPDAEHEYVHGPYWRERTMIPLWHLLSLLLSARQDYVMAARACEGAFEQFKDPSVLFGSDAMYRSEHLNEAEANDEKNAGWSRGLVDDMEDFEKERILEVKMTQLALVELLESPKVAVNASLELLSLFARLFGPPQATKATLSVAPRTNSVPKSSAGTLRSIKGSIFGRSGERGGRPTTKHSSMIGLDKNGSAAGTRPQTTQTVASRDAPTIQVTSNDFDDFRRSRKPGNFNERRSQSGKRNSLRKRDSSGSRRRAVSSGGAPPRSAVEDGGHDGLVSPLGESQSGEFFSPLPTRQRVSSAASGPPPVSMSRQASQVDSIAASASRARLGGDGDGRSGLPAAPESVETALSLTPIVQFSKDDEKRRRNTVLVEVWLMIAGFYRRSEMLDDAKRATVEAQKLVQDMEIDASRNLTSGASLRDRGWVGKKSVDELWADVWAEMGHLSLHKGAPYNARLDFEAALTHFPDHPAATIGLSNILLDIYSKKLLLPHAIPRLELADGTMFPEKQRPAEHSDKELRPTLPSEPLGLLTAPAAQDKEERRKKPAAGTATAAETDVAAAAHAKSDSELPPPYKASTLPPIDRLAARDRAFALLSGLTKLGSSWDNSEAWFALARAHEESGQPDKAKEVLWWCVELEEAAAVRPWSAVATSGYVL
ncbi:filamentation protein [Sporothrix brasiliensis 5110]|uniref:Filamentation protein n=1 Tax=Sporothrix brasiliensis 5110 TaxID=1398154 RepID=A0A0C2IT58_9PEZI|nr:filamentation protein [Sporothrix brasiliensis 5110]KIH92231.1 filamentation protein [Sporothrix brasiliensis 5110]